MAGSPGPLLRAREGDLLRVELVNRLDEPTNLHFHGLHVSPGGNSDNVFVDGAARRPLPLRAADPGGPGRHVLVSSARASPPGPAAVARPRRAADRRSARAIARSGWPRADERVVVVKDLTIVDGRPAPHTTSRLGARQERAAWSSPTAGSGRSIAASAATVWLRLVNACNGRILLLARGDGRPLLGDRA